MVFGTVTRSLIVEYGERTTPIEIVVTTEMVDAGIETLYEFNYGEDPRYIIECVFRAMAYESPLLSVAKLGKGDDHADT
jgi:hypothetical protein